MSFRSCILIGFVFAIASGATEALGTVSLPVVLAMQFSQPQKVAILDDNEADDNEAARRAASEAFEKRAIEEALKRRAEKMQAEEAKKREPKKANRKRTATSSNEAQLVTLGFGALVGAIVGLGIGGYTGIRMGTFLKSRDRFPFAGDIILVSGLAAGFVLTNLGAIGIAVSQSPLPAATAFVGLGILLSMMWAGTYRLCLEKGFSPGVSLLLICTSPFGHAIGRFLPADSHEPSKE